MQPMAMDPNDGNKGLLWVTSKNQDWIAQETGLSRRVIAKMYAVAREKNVVLTISRSSNGTLDSTVGVPELFD